MTSSHDNPYLQVPCQNFRDWFINCRGFWEKKTYPLVMTNIAIENGPVEIVDFPIKHGDFPIKNGVFGKQTIKHILSTWPF